MNKKLILLSFLGILAISLGFFQFPQFFSNSAPVVAQSSANKPLAFPAASQSPANPPVASTASAAKTAAPMPRPVAAASSIRPETTAFLEAVLNQTVSIDHGGALRELVLAKDELYVRNSDGIGRVVSIPSASNASELSGQIEKLQKENGSAPQLILYPPGATRDDSTRRIVTRDILIEADSRSAADSLASGLSFKSAPVYAKGKYIYEAPSSPEALAFFIKTADSASSNVTPLLASKVAKMTMPNDPLVQKQWHLKFQNQLGAVSGTDVNVESVWKYPKTKAFVYESGNANTDYIRGNGVTIGIVDDGMEWSHPDLLPNVLRNLQKDWNGKDNDPKPYFYDDNHGTACAGVAAARGNNRIGVTGVAPEANLVGMRLIADVQTDADIAEAMTWYLDAIHIKSNSWGYYAFTTNSSSGLFQSWNPIVSPDPLTEAALEYAAKYGRGGKGSIITFAAGNHDEFRLTSNGSAQKSGARIDFQALPNSIYTIAVGAVNSLGKKSNYSQVGSSLLISAPSNTSDGTGLGIMTTDNIGPRGYNYGIHNTLFTWPPVDDFKGSGDVTQAFGGTSSATPAVSGVIALMLQCNPNLGWRDVQEILIRSAFKIDPGDSGWISANRTVSGNATEEFHFNDKYGAGLVDAAAAVDLASSWTNLGPQKSQRGTTNLPPLIAAGATQNRTFTINGDDLRVEHVTLRLTIEAIKKGDLTIKLTSPDGTESVFCEPHSDNINNFTDWTFMTVRNWGESSNGDWTLTITNHGATPGNLTSAELLVYGTDEDALVDAPVVTLEASKTSVFVGSNLTLTATAKDKNNGRVENLEAFAGAESLRVSSDGTWNIKANKAGSYTFTVNATDGNGAVATSNEVEVEVLEAPIAAWDFDTATISPVPLASAVQGSKQYAANFGSGNLIFNGNSEETNLWSFKNGEIWKGNGMTTNAVGEMWDDTLENTALLLRGGKNIGAEGKCLIFEFSMVNRGQLNVSYAFSGNSAGFTTHAWSYSTDGTNWNETQAVSPVGSTVVLDSISVPSEPKVYLRVQFSGATAASGENLIDNIYFSASPIPVDPVSENFTVLARAAAKSQSYGLGSQTSQANETAEATSQAESEASEDSQNLDWVLEKPSIHEMVVHAEVVEGGQFLNAAGSLLSANEDGKVLGLAEPILQSTRYELGITSADPSPQPLRLKVYDSKSKGILVLEEKVPFAPGATIGSPSTPKRYKVAYQEAEQVVMVSTGWNTFTTVVDPDPATLAGAFSDYDYSDGDQLVGPGVEAYVVNGKWNPVGVKLEPKATYSILRQAQTDSQIILKGKAVEESSSPLPVKPVDLPTVKSSATSSNSGHSHSPAPAASSAAGSNSATKAMNSSKGSKKVKSSTSSKKKSGKKSKTKAS